MRRGGSMPMSIRGTTGNALRTPGAVMAAAALLALGCARTAPTPAQRTPTEQHFAEPKAAVAALVAACRTYDERALLAIFGQDSGPLISTGSPDADRERCRRLVAAAAHQKPLPPPRPPPP